MKKTPLYETHLELGAKIIDFGGWMLPVQYSSIIKEHNAVRESAGVFDVSHMGEIYITGKDAADFADYLVTNDLSDIKSGMVIYSPMCYLDGGTVDDVLVYCLSAKNYLFVVNASNIEKDFNWIKSNSKDFEVKVENLSESYGQIAVQGPKAQEILSEMTDINLNDIEFFKFNTSMEIGGVRALVSRTGYTGEDGFELYLSVADAPKLFTEILKIGKDRIEPCGLGARDTLRFESCLPLYGHELSQDISPLKAGLKYFVRLNAGKFMGRDALMNEEKTGLLKKSTGFEMLERGIARNGYSVFNSTGDKIGVVTSGSMCPTLSKNMGMGLLDTKYAKSGTEIYIGIRNKKVKAITVKKPFYKKKYRKQEV
ncbi:MAG: glycine cleavage system aminomethyltransferase GcvT [Clostridiales bacterium]|nr:glycine cleavage system aminomethyltransferase GcvT [Clostridiales bacterium]